MTALPEGEPRLLANHIRNGVYRYRYAPLTVLRIPAKPAAVFCGVQISVCSSVPIRANPLASSKGRAEGISAPEQHTNRAANPDLKGPPGWEAPCLLAAAVVFPLVAAAVVTAAVAAAAVVGVEAALVAAPAEQDQQDDDPQAVIPTETVIAHINTSGF